jgi:hypothetical protein
VPALAASLIGSVRMHLYGCAMLPAVVRRRARKARVVGQTLLVPGPGAARLEFAHEEEAREEPRCALATAESVRSPHAVH